MKNTKPDAQAVPAKPEASATHAEISPDVASIEAQPGRPLWKRRFIDPVLRQLTQGVTPDKIAFTVALGMGIGMFPIIGLTTVLAIIGGIIFRLNLPLMQLVAHSILPLHLTSIYFCMRWGETLFGVAHAQYGGIHAMAHHMSQLFWSSQLQFWEEFGLLAFHAAIVWLILLPVWTVVMYFVLRPIVRALQRWKNRVAVVQNTTTA